MSLIKFNDRNRLFPWNNSNLKDFWGSNQFFNDDFFAEEGFMPAMNIKENDEDFEIEFSAPGFSKTDFEVTIEDDILHICGEKSKEEEEKEENYTRKEFSYNSFKRSLKLPSAINRDSEVKATYKNGILKFKLLKSEESKLGSQKVIEVV